MSWVISCAVIEGVFKRAGQGRWGEHQGADRELRELSEGWSERGMLRLGSSEGSGSWGGGVGSGRRQRGQRQRRGRQRRDDDEDWE